MFKLDETFLQELGLENLPAEQRAAFLEQVYASLTERVGERLSSGMSDEQPSSLKLLLIARSQSLLPGCKPMSPNMPKIPSLCAW